MKYKEEGFYNEVGETPEQAALRGGGCPNPWKFQDQVGCNSEQLNLFEDVPDYCRGTELDGF